MTIPGAVDVRGFYNALGIELPGWASIEAPARCFASPESHNHDDRSPSTSVNLESGLWCCHRCGAGGRAYDAAIAVGLTPRSAVELTIRYGLLEPGTEPRSTFNAGQRSTTNQRPPAPRRRQVTLEAGDADVERWQESLHRRPALLERLEQDRGWSYPVLRELEIGIGPGGRLTVPIRNQSGRLRGILRYQPWHTNEPKMLAVRGTRLGLIPHPAREASRTLLLVEGPPDMLAARARGLPAVAVPGTQAWRPEWAKLLAGRPVTVVLDCDQPGRDAGQRIAADLGGCCDVRVVDLDPRRETGYDLTDALLDQPHQTLALVGHATQSVHATRETNAIRGIER